MSLKNAVNKTFSKQRMKRHCTLFFSHHYTYLHTEVEAITPCVSWFGTRFLPRRENVLKSLLKSLHFVVHVPTTSGQRGQ